MALGGLGAVLLSGHPSLSPSHVISQVDLRSVFFAVVFVIIVLVLAYLTNPSETSFRTYLTEQSFKQHLSRLDDGGQEEGVASDDSGLHFTLSRRIPPGTRKSGSNFDPSSPFHFVSRASVSLRTPKHVFYSFGILTIAAVYPTGRPHARGPGPTITSENIVSSVSDAWFIGAFGRWWRGGVIQSWWHDMLATPKDAERGGSGILDVKALDILDGYEGLPFPTPSRLPSDAAAKLRGTERSTARSTTAAPRSNTPPPLPKSASLPLHAPRNSPATPPKGNAAQVQRHASSPAQAPTSSTPELTRPPAPPMLSYSPSSTSLFDSSPVIAEVLRQISQSKAAVVELSSQLTEFQSSAEKTRAIIQSELEEQRKRKREEDAARAELKTRTKTLEDRKRSAESSKREAEKRLRAAESARDSATARIGKLEAEIGALKTRMNADEEEIVRRKEEGDVKEKETQEELERKRKEIKVAEDVISALNSRAKELEERIAQEEDRLRKAKEQAEIKKQDRSFYPLHVVPAVNEEDITIPSWSATGSYPLPSDAQTLGQPSSDYAPRQQEGFPQPIQPPRSKGSVSSGSGNSDHREPSESPRPARLSLTGISNLRESSQRVISEPESHSQLVIRPPMFPLLSGDVPSALSNRTTSTRFSPFSDTEEVVEEKAFVPASDPASTTSISPTSSSLIPTSLIHSLDGAGSIENVGLSRSFQSADDTVLDRDWRKNTRFPPPPPVESPNSGRAAYTTSPLSLTCPSFDGVDQEDPFEVRLPHMRRRLTSDLMDMQRAALPPSRTNPDPPLPPIGLLNGGRREHDVQDKAVSHRRWFSQQDAAKERKGLNPEAKAFSLNKKSSPSLFNASQMYAHGHSTSYDGVMQNGGPYSSGSLSSLSSHHGSLSTSSSLSIPPSLAHHGADSDTVFSSMFGRAFAPSPEEREALQRALGGSTNTSLERLPTLSEVSSIPSMSMPSSPAHTHAPAASLVSGLNANMGIAVGATGTSNDGAVGLGAGRTHLPPGLSWLQSLPRMRKPKFSPWEDEETKETSVEEGR
ncbi:hypothetical protein BN946_scf184941.g12 [Trametes cinnabarina]|uniref:Uncharacterized protein n=1 Tax=Pycnoporus cinnabarinus TaxID=5643 RepID=A0A060STU9_PYCCI|nr:hypothetical protein BN946_scf184941.g12 [Trametes cinnabarina]